MLRADETSVLGSATRHRLQDGDSRLSLPRRAVTAAILLATCCGAQELRLQIASEGRPTAARVYITGSDGAARRIPNTVGYNRRGETHSLVDGAASLRLPPGRYRVRVEKGMEFRPLEKTVDVSGHVPTLVQFDLARFQDMNARGWYSGDLHIHRDPAEMSMVLRAEELNVAPVITRHVGGPRVNVPLAAPLPPVRTGPAQIATFNNQEVERLKKGHGAVVLLNTPEPVPDHLPELFPMDLEFCRKARAQGGFVDAEKPIWKNVPVNVALGVVDSVGVVNNHFHPGGMLLDAETYGSMARERDEYRTPAGFAAWVLDLYYSFLNCGFRLPVSAGSASGVMPSWPGYERVYVHLGGKFDYDAWFAALKAGRSFATNGPLLEARVNGELPGAQFRYRGGEAVNVTIDAHTQARFDRVELVFNGEVIRSMRPENADFHASFPVPVSMPGWLAARCFEPAEATVRYAHTSPFYFTTGGKLPVRKRDAARWADYLGKLARSLTEADYPSAESYTVAQRALKEAQSVYLRTGPR